MPEIPEIVAYQDKFKDDFIIATQQKDFQLAGWVQDDPAFAMGRAGYFDVIGATELNASGSLYADTQWADIEFSRRKAIKQMFDWARPIARGSIAQLGRNPQNAYVMSARAAFNRKKTTVCLEAAIADATAADEDMAESTVTFPATQIVESGGGGTGLTLDKLIAALEVDNENEIEDGERRLICIAPKQLTNMLNITEFKSRDFNEATLKEGTVTRFMGHDWLVTNRLNKSGNIRQCISMTADALGYFGDADPFVRIAERPDKRHVLQIYMEMFFGAVRVEDVRVKRIDCDESV